MAPDDEGIVNIISNDAEAMEKAKEIIINLTAEPEIGQTYRGKITSVVDFGVFVKIYNVEGLCHVSELSHERIDDVRAHFKVGELIDVKVKEMKNGKYSLSHKALLKKMQPQG